MAAKMLRLLSLGLGLAVTAGLVAAGKADDDTDVGPECAHIFAETGVPVIDEDASTSDAGFTFVCRQGYALLFNNTTHVPEWVAEEVTLEQITGDARRHNKFRPDPLTPPPSGSTLDQYRNSGFDRGHQAPAADFKQSQPLTDQTFFLSNVAPQVGECFDRGIWAELEGQIRNWLETRKRLIVFTGPVYSEPIKRVGDLVVDKAGDDLAVPASFYKIVYQPYTGQSVAFLMPNEKLCEKDPEEFTTSVRHIQELTGIDFFSALSYREQAVIERNTGNDWGW